MVLPHFRRNFGKLATAADGLSVGCATCKSYRWPQTRHCILGCDTAMSRFIRASVTADLMGRLFNLLLFLFLLPFVWLLSRQPQIDKVMPDGRVWPNSARR
jgi:hypothetical protein